MSPAISTAGNRHALRFQADQPAPGADRLDAPDVSAFRPAHQFGAAIQPAARGVRDAEHDHRRVRVRRPATTTTSVDAHAAIGRDVDHGVHSQRRRALHALEPLR